MLSRRSRDSRAMLLLLAGCLAAGAANASPITLCANVDFCADHVAASASIGGSSSATPAGFEVALGLAPRPTDLSIAPLAVSFRRWDDDVLGMPSDVPAAPVASGR